MPYNLEIDSSIRKVMLSWKNTDAKKMFGGVCYLMNGNMVCGVYKEFLILRLGEELGEKAMENPFVRPFDITGRPIKGWIMVAQEGFKTENELEDWLNQAKKFVETLPPK
jgi:TfoX/Sxy family transcriptional regulator of competence genes